MPRPRAAALVLAAAVSLALAGCAGGGSSDTASGTGTTTATSTTAGTAAVTLQDAWVKVPSESMPTMTGMFGTLTNSTGEALTVTAGTSSVAGTVELHETVTVDGASQMQQKEGGFEVPANGTFELAPGANHIMLMDLTGEIVAGDEVTVDLTLSDGSTVTVTALAKAYDGAEETYAGTGTMTMDGM